jgi:hypothetical protein
VIHTTETYFGHRPVEIVPGVRAPLMEALAPERMAEAMPLMAWHRHDAVWSPPQQVAPKTAALPAFVSGGRWLVQCPACHSAQYTTQADPRFFCIDCLNEHAKGKWLPVVWPEDRAAIEAALEARPDHHTRTWMPHESVEDLHAQNAEHGVS